GGGREGDGNMGRAPAEGLGQEDLTLRREVELFTTEIEARELETAVSKGPAQRHGVGVDGDVFESSEAWLPGCRAERELALAVAAGRVRDRELQAQAPGGTP